MTDLYLLNDDELKAYYPISDIRLEIVSKYSNATIDEALNTLANEDFTRACKEKDIDVQAAYDIAKSALGKKWFTVFISGTEFTNEQAVIDFNPRIVLGMVTSDDPDKSVQLIRSEHPEFYRIFEGCNKADNPDEYIRLQREALGLNEYLYVEDGILYTLQSVLEVFAPLSDEYKPRRLGALSLTPSTYAFSMLSRLMNAGGRAQPEGSVRSITNTHEVIDWVQGANKNDWTLRGTTKNSTAEIHIRNYGMFADSTTPSDGKEKSVRTTSMRGVKKVTRFILSQIMLQSSGGRVPAYIDIDLEEMVEKKLYTRTDNAQRGLEAAYMKMSLIDIKQEFTHKFTDEKGKKKSEKYTGGGALVVGREYFPHNRARIWLQPTFDYRFFSNYSHFPSWAYALNDNAFELVDHVFRMLRMNGADLKKKGYISMQLLTVSETMGLKTPEEVRLNHQRKYAKYIKEPIETAVKEINKVASADKSVSGNLRIKVHAPKTNDIEKWLTGELRISADGEYAEKSLSLADRYESLLTDGP